MDGEAQTAESPESIHHRKPIIGLAGGICSGKSAVAEMFGQMGAGVIRSDDLSRQEMDTQEVRETLGRWWGQSILTAEGSLNREQVAAIVFGDPAQRQQLESLLHPRIAVRRADLVAQFEKQAKISAIVLDSPLLYETDLDLSCDAVVFVDAAPERRKARSEKARNWPEGELARREKTQQPLDLKRARADYICDNNSSLAALRQQVERILAQIVSRAGGT